MNRTFRTLALGAVLGLAVAGCQANQPGSPAASAPTATASATGHATPAAAASQPGATATAATAGTAAPTATAPSGTGVVADCTGPAPYSLSREPASIPLACADNGIGVQDMTWTTWTASTATGYGTLWEKLCVPNCATGQIGYYPVDVTLSAVKSSAGGQWFSRLTVTWEGNRPPNQTPDTFTLMSPG